MQWRGTNIDVSETVKEQEFADMKIITDTFLTVDNIFSRIMITVKSTTLGHKHGFKCISPLCFYAEGNEPELKYGSRSINLSGRWSPSKNNFLRLDVKLRRTWTNNVSQYSTS